MSTTRGCRSRRKGRGQALVEFALMSPIIFVLLIGIIETGRLVYIFHLLNNAAREGARYAIVHGENAFDGCPSGPTPPGVTACDAAGDNIRDQIIRKSPGLSSSSLSFGWSGESTFPLYCWPGEIAPSCTGNNKVGNDVTVRLEYTYAPLVLSEILGSFTARAEATLVINN